MGIVTLTQNQKRQLLAKTDGLEGFFRDIMVPALGVSLPFLPIRAFRQFAIDSAPAGRRQLFHSSGSTNSQRATHAFSPEGLRIYAEGTSKGFGEFLRRMDFPSDTPLLSLVPPPELWPSSSLAAMISMFREAGFPVRYCHPEANPTSVFSELSALESDDAILFGTSFHHVWTTRTAETLKLPPPFRGRRLLIIDTGGTKGKTEIFTQEEILTRLRRTFGSGTDVVFASEYGMCELASQAWSANIPHDGVFICNETLLPLALSPEDLRVLPHGETGFLAFVDSNNTDSFPCLVTEDLGCTEPGGRFRLEGRAPDATLKGCSLNVRDDFLVEVPAPRNTLGASIQPPQPAPKRTSTAFDGGMVQRAQSHLANTAPWPEPFLDELLGALAGWEKAPEAIRKEGRPQPGASLEIVASANIPITWIFPAATACLLGFGEVIVTLPTLRSDDPISAQVIAQIEMLAELLRTELAPMRITLRRKGALSQGPATQDTLLVFGSDATCDTFQKRYQGQVRRLVTLGDVWNSAVVDGDSPSEAARLASAWQGRGCLTPLALFSRTPWSEASLETFLATFERRMAAFLANAPSVYRFSHRHDLWEMAARLKPLGSENRIFRMPHASVVDLRGIDPLALQRATLPWQAAGAGLLFLLDERERYPWLHWLRTESVYPGITDAHCGATWARWLSQNGKAETPRGASDPR